MTIIARLKQRKWLIATGIILVVIVVWISINASKTPAQVTIAVRRGAVTETVNVTGNTTSTQSVALGFQNSGRIVGVGYQTGDRISAGSVIASLDTSDLQAQRAQAQASVDAQNATLSKLQAGPTAQTIAVSQAALTTANQNLANAYSSVTNTISDSYTKANDAVRNQLSAFFTNPESNNPTFNITLTDNQASNNAVSGRVQAGGVLNTWQTSLAGISISGSQASLDASLQSAATSLTTIKQFLAAIAHALTVTSNLSTATLATYQTSLNTAVAEVNTASTNVTTATQTIANQKNAVAQAQAQLSLTSASSTPEDIAAQQAQVEAAQANVASIDVKIRQAQLVSPIDGVVTVQNAKVGQIATPGVTLVSIISNSKFQIQANIPEVDVGKIAIGNGVALTFDAFPGETFDGAITYIDPAETVVSGVVDYKIKIGLKKADPRLKSGLTANCSINAKTDTGVLILPQYAVLQNASGTFVQVTSGGKTTQVPVTLGIQDQNGNVEITSGVTEGQQVLNIGLKTQ